MRDPRELNRRELLELGIAAGLSAGLLGATRAQDAPTTSTAGRPRNIVFMVADGMSLGVPSLAEPFSQLVRETGTAWAALLRDPRNTLGFFDTGSLNSPVTDSAAASTAWSSGSRVFNGFLNVLPDGTTLTPIGALVHDAGLRMGLVTTTTVTHATPAGFAAVQTNRGDEQLIAPQYLDRVDVILGGGRKFFDAARRKDGHDLIGEFVGRGYTFWEQRGQLTGSARPPRVLGLFDDGHLPYTIDQRNTAELAQRVPTLAEMTQAALELLAAGDRGFVLQVEGGRVDHAAHGNDAAALLWDQLAFDDAIAAVVAFARRRGDTLVVITSDHGNANPGLNGMGGGYGASQRCLARLTRATMSLDRLACDLRPGRDQPALPAERVIELVRVAQGVDISREHADVLRNVAAGAATAALNAQRAGLLAVLGEILANHNGVSWTGVSHTQDLTLVTALGPGAERFAGLRQNAEAFEPLTALLDIHHQNPRMSTEQAQRYAAAASEHLPPDWA